MVTVKICGVTSRQDAVLCVEAGADAVGINFYERSPRYVPPDKAREIVEAVAGRVLTVGVFVDAPSATLDEMKRVSRIDCVQLHGDEPPEELERLLPHAYKALRVRDRASVAAASRYPGRYLLLDAYVPGQAGGTGARFDWDLAKGLARERRLALAGGLTPDNVQEAVARVAPYCVDVASGVERSPGKKDPALVCAFVSRAKGVGGAAG